MKNINNLKITTQNLENIRTTQGQKAFEAAFGKEFGVKYDEKAIQHYEEIAETRNTVKGLKASIDEISNSSSIRQLEMLSRASKHYGDAPELEMKKQTAYLGAYQDFMRSLPADARNNPELVQLSNYSVQNFEKLKNSKTIAKEFFNIDDSISYIGDEAFYDCTQLTEVNMSPNVTSLGNLAFSKSYNITYFDIPESLTSIPDNAFDGCFNLKKILIP